MPCAWSSQGTVEKWLYGELQRQRESLAWWFGELHVSSSAYLMDSKVGSRRCGNLPVK